jgi:threonine synthase
VCESCQKPLFVLYELAAVGVDFLPRYLRRRSLRSLWRFWDVLPIADPMGAISLGEGLTPLVPCRRTGPFARFERLYVKDESLNPTGSFKARGMSVAITRALAMGTREVALPSAGNAGGAAAAYAARAGLRCHVFMPVDTPRANIVEAHEAGAKVTLVRGLISDCGTIVRAASERYGWFDLSTLKEPFRLEGKKTMAYELALDLADTEQDSEGVSLPDVILYPTGGGTGLIGMWKAFDEMIDLGWIRAGDRPRMVAVQAEGCAPIVRAYERGDDTAKPVPEATTVASGLRVPAAIGDFLMLRAIRESGGTAVTVTDEELLSGARDLARHQGIHACPEGGATWRAAEKLLDAGWLQASDRVVLFNTGTGLKYLETVRLPDLPVLDPSDPNVIDRVEA